ncbi:hypothetical protein ACFO0N_18375 [Halobium salinum]|uniref:DUF7964 domain-containing protein n=1 Tax=Halobium salinum TaxID=1364940 RepID=A0ABD5PGF0_9EURY|nr:hypothetical protein [Halobium salinum]
MSILDSLPDRPLTDGEVAKLNRANSVELAVAVDPGENAADANEGATEALLLGTDRWVKALVRDAGWHVVETVSLDESERYEAMRACEDAVRAYRRESRPAEEPSGS